MIRILIFEDNLSFRTNLVTFLRSEEDIEVVGAYGDPREVINHIKKDRPDLILMDIQMPFISGLEALALIKNYDAGIKVLIQSIHSDDDKIFNAVCNGASGYILKSSGPEQYLTAIKDAMNGGSPLSPTIATKVLSFFQSNIPTVKTPYIELTKKEKEILIYLSEGNSYKMIAEVCFVSLNTVRTHMKHIYEKLHVNSATEALAKARKNKLI